MSVLNMSDDEKKEILNKHKTATKEVRDRQAAERGGIQTPEKKEQKKED